MKKISIAIAALICLSTVLTIAQPRGGMPGRLSPEKREKVEAMKVAFFTNKLDLTPEEAKVFWPVYNAYQDELMGLRETRRNEMFAMRDSTKNLTDKDYEKIVDGEITFRQSELDLMKKYQPQLRKTLPIKKLAKLERAEDEFKRELLHMIRERDGKPGGPSNRPKRK